MLRKIRRIVSGHNAQGKSVIASDAPSPHVLSLTTDPPFGLTDLWVTHGSPADNSGSADGAARPAITLEPPRGGSIFRVVEFPPDQATAGKLDRKKLFEAMHAGGAMDHEGTRHAGMHKTATTARKLPDTSRSPCAPARSPGASAPDRSPRCRERAPRSSWCPPYGVDAARVCHVTGASGLVESELAAPGRGRLRSGML